MLALYGQRTFRSKGGPAMSDLIIIGYPDETTAQKVWEQPTTSAGTPT